MNGYLKRRLVRLETLRREQEAEPTPYDPNDPVAVRYEDARRVHEFVKLKREAEGATGPYRYDSIAAVYQLAERMDAEREAAAQREGGEQ